MEQNAYEMVHRGLLAEELAIQHVRKPGNGVPITGMAGRERPLNIFPIQTALNVRIGRDIIRIVVIDEVVSESGQVNGESQYREQEAEQGRGTELFMPGQRVRRCGFGWRL